MPMTSKGTETLEWEKKQDMTFKCLGPVCLFLYLYFHFKDDDLKVTALLKVFNVGV